MTLYQWVALGLGAAGFLATWLFGAFKLGRAVEQMQGAIKDKIDAEKLARMEAFERLREEFAESQRTQGHNFGEVGAAMRQYTADVEKQVRELEIWSRDHFVQKSEFERATETIRQDIKEMTRSIKEDFKDLNAKIDAKS